MSVIDGDQVPGVVLAAVLAELGVDATHTAAWAARQRECASSLPLEALAVVAA